MKATVDRIEGKIAVLVTRENPFVFNLPLSFIDDIWEGDVVDITITRSRNYRCNKGAR